MSTPKPIDPRRKSQREREEERRRREAPRQPGETPTPEIDRPSEPEETEEHWSRTPR
jgi:hypothetical protein